MVDNSDVLLRLASGEPLTLREHFDQIYYALRPVSLRDTADVKPLETPRHWNLEEMPYTTESGKQLTARVYTSPVVSPKAIFAYFTGFGAHPSDDDEKKAIKYLNDSGFSVVAINLNLDESDPKNKISNNFKRAETFIYSPNSPLHTLYPRDLPRFIAAHSTAGMVVGRVIVENEANKKPLPSSIKQVYEICPMFDTAGSSDKFHPICAHFYTGHALRNAEQKTGDPLFDRIHYALNGIGHRLKTNKDQAPTHGDVLTLKAYGAGFMHLIRQLKKRGELESLHLPFTFVLSDNDHFACHLTNEYIAETLMEKEILWGHSEHNPQLNPEHFDLMINHAYEILGIQSPKPQNEPGSLIDELFGPKTEDADPAGALHLNEI